jgi:polyhydroxybutyrate depolymerase
MVRLPAIAALGGALACGSADPGSVETGSDDGGASTSEDTGDPPVGTSTSAQPGSAGDTGSLPPATDDGEDTTDADGGSDTGPAPSACDAASLFEPGTHTDITVDVDGTARRYDLFVPSGYDATVDTPLVLNFHGLFGSPSQQADFSQFDGAAEAHGMLVAYPEGIGQSFNGGVCCGEASSSGIDDVAFARAIVADVSAKMCVDPSRVYATGMSNGGHMAHRLACEAADVFAAAASVTGVLSLAGPCTPSRPISMVQFHGTADNIVGFAPVPAMMADWAARNGCSAVSETTFEQGDMHCETWPGCDAGVEVSSCTIDGGGHCWPGNGDCLFGHSSTELHASEAIATLFDAQTLP